MKQILLIILFGSLLPGINAQHVSFNNFNQHESVVVLTNPTKVKIHKNRRPLVYSSHHQSIEKMGKGHEATALSADGKIIEAVAHRTFPHVFAVQFHPEVPALYENMDKRKFNPSDPPASYHELIGKESIKFHEQYWKYVSKALKSAIRKQR